MNSQTVIHTVPVVCRMGAELAVAKTRSDDGVKPCECLV